MVPPRKVSETKPAGPSESEGIIVAEKSISVSNIVAGTTRLQPVVLGIGQAAGTLAAVAIKGNLPVSKINIRDAGGAMKPQCTENRIYQYKSPLL